MYVHIICSGVCETSVQCTFYCHRYCDQVAEPEIDNLVELLLRELGRFQDRVYMKEPQKLKTKRRYVCGLREVAKHLMLKKLKVVLIARNLDRITSTGTTALGLNHLCQPFVCHSSQCVYYYCVCVLYVLCMCAVCTVYVCSMYCVYYYCVCVLYVLCMCAVCTVYVCSMYCVYVLYVLLCVQYVLCMCVVIPSMFVCTEL